MNIKEFLERENIGDVLFDEELKKHTTYKVGGVCDYFVLPSSLEKLLLLLKYIKQNNIKYKVLGNGSNVIFSSKRFNGIIINSYEISFPNKYIKSLIFFKGFNIQVLYESFIYKNTSPNNIKKELYDDNINIVSLIGKYDKIRKSEFYKTEKEVKNK